jgi:hypothetical protein
VTISATLSDISSTADPMCSNAARLPDCGHVLLGPARTLGDDPHHLLGLALDLADELGDLTGRVLGLLGELADLLGHYREAAALLTFVELARMGGVEDDEAVDHLRVACATRVSS